MEAVLPDATILAAGLVMFRFGTRSAGNPCADNEVNKIPKQMTLKK